MAAPIGVCELCLIIGNWQAHRPACGYAARHDHLPAGERPDQDHRLRAKEVAPIAEKMITLAKNANLANYRRALSWLTKEDVAKKLFDEIGPKYALRNGGYTRVVKDRPPPRRRR